LQILCCKLNINFVNVYRPCTHMKASAEDFLATVLLKLCPQVEQQYNSEKRKNYEILFLRQFGLEMWHNVKIFF